MATVEATPDARTATVADRTPPGGGVVPTGVLDAAMVVIAALGMVGSVLPWAVLGGSRARVVRTYLDVQGQGLGGLDRNGAVTVVAFLAAGGFALARVLGRQRRATPLVGAAAGLVAVVLALVDRDIGAGIEGEYGPSVGAAAISSTVGVGLWLTLLAAVMLVATSVVALVRER